MFRLRKLSAWNQAQQSVVADFANIAPEAAKAQSHNTTVIAFHTDDAFYAREAKRLSASARRLNITVQITVVPSAGSWVKNAALKARFLQHARQTIRGPILYVDVDAVFHRAPFHYLETLNCDIAAHYDCSDGHLISATLFLNDTPAVQSLLNQWVLQCEVQPEAWDQKVLEDLLATSLSTERPTYQVHPLPVVFCWVFDREHNAQFQQGLPVFIEQLQASRELKEKKRTWFVKQRCSENTRRRIDRTQQIEEVLFGRLGG